MARTVLPIVGAVVGAYFGSPQIGYAIGSVIGNAVDPLKVQGPKIGETGAQTTAEGVPRAIIYGTISCTGNVILAGPLVIREEETQQGKGGGPVTVSERCFRTYAVRICEGPIAGVLRIWEDDKLVYDVRSTSPIFAESMKWFSNKRIYLGDEDQLPDPSLELVNSDMPAYRGTAYIVFDGSDLTDRRGSIPQYRFEVCSVISDPVVGTTITATTTINNTQTPASFFRRDSDGNATVVTAPVGGITIGSTALHVTTYDAALSVVDTQSPVVNGAGTWGDLSNPGLTLLQLQGASQGIGVFMNGSSFSSCYLGWTNGQQAMLKPSAAFSDFWWSSANGEPEFDGRRIWFSSSNVYIGTTKRNNVQVNNICCWPIGSSGSPAYASHILSNVAATPGNQFYMHWGNDDLLRVVVEGNYKVYNPDLTLVSTEVLPFSTTNMHGFGVDYIVSAFVYSATARIDFRLTSDWSLIGSIGHTDFGQTRSTRVVFTDDSIFIQTQSNVAVTPQATKIFRIPYTRGDGGSVILGDIVADISDRCNLTPSQIDVTELTDEVAGLVLAGEYTGADAINTLRSPYFFDAYNADKKIRFPKRGADAAFVIDIDDLVEDPDISKREQAIEYPKKMHLQYQHANSGYAVVKATSSRSSPDARVVGEMTISVPVVLDENQAAQTVAKLHKVAWAEADGDIELSVPDSFIGYTPTDVGSVTLRGNTIRRRIESTDYADGIIKWKLKKDRQSAYTSDVQGVPVPDPTPPPSTIVGETVLAVMDISSRIDTEDDLNIYYGVTGAMPAWHGATVQRSTDLGANYTNVASIQQASLIGYITGTVADADEHFTDTTNTIHVTLYRDGQELQSITNAEFLSEENPFALENPDGTWEIMQFRDRVETSNGDFVLSTLHRGLLNSGTSSHSDGALFVMLARPTHVEMTSSLIGQSLTHRAPSFEQSPELAAEQTATYVGRSQIEWPVAYLNLSRSGSNISATWTPRHRFGTDDNPVASINFQGYRVTIDGGSNGSVTFDTTTAGFTNYDATAYGGGLTVSVSALNRITGAGPVTSGII